LSITITHEEKWVHTHTNRKRKRRKKKKRENNKEQIKGKKRTVKRLKSGAGLEFWK